MEKEARILSISEDQTSGTLELIDEPGTPREFRVPVAVAVIPGELVVVVVETPSGIIRVVKKPIGQPT